MGGSMGGVTQSQKEVGGDTVTSVYGRNKAPRYFVQIEELSRYAKFNGGVNNERAAKCIRPSPAKQ